MSLGVEIELQLIDPETRDLSSEAPRVFRLLGDDEQSIKPEILRSMVEVTTGVCDTVGEVRSELITAVARLQCACDRIGVVLAGSGSHPFAQHRQRLVFPSDRFDFLIDRNRWVARRLMIFALHLHVGMRDGDHAMAMINGMAHYLPHALALSASSPYWQGSDTGLASSRITIFEAMPTSGHPCLFHTWSEFRAFYEAAVAARALTSIKDLWWDIRPHPDLGTVELRICDGLPTISEVVGLVALLQSIYAWLDARYRDGEELRPPPMWVLRENKWRATRWGIEAEIIVDATGQTRPLLGEIEKLIEIVEPHSRTLGGSQDLARLQQRLRAGLSYERQRAVYDLSNDLVSVTDALVEEFRTDRPFSD
jgi:carboxylate-amine ligase